MFLIFEKGKNEEIRFAKKCRKFGEERISGLWAEKYISKTAILEEKNARSGRTGDGKINARGIHEWTAFYCTPAKFACGKYHWLIASVCPFPRRSIEKTKRAGIKVTRPCCSPRDGKRLHDGVKSKLRGRKNKNKKREREEREKKAARMPSVPTYEFLSMANLRLRKWTRQGARKKRFYTFRRCDFFHRQSVLFFSAFFFWEAPSE